MNNKEPEVGFGYKKWDSNMEHESSGRSPLGISAREAVAVLAVLGHRLRLDLWAMITPCGPAGLSAGLIANRLAVAPSTLSFHLQQMTQAGVLVQRRSGRKMIYAANKEVIVALCGFLVSAVE